MDLRWGGDTVLPGDYSLFGRIGGIGHGGRIARGVSAHTNGLLGLRFEPDGSVELRFRLGQVLG